MSSYSPQGVNGLTVEQATHNVHVAIRSLLADEYPDLARRRFKEKDSHWYIYTSTRTVVNYLRTTMSTWKGVIWSFGKMFVGGVSPIDFAIALVYSAATTIILTGGLIICIIVNVPLLVRLYNWYSGKFHQGVSFINIVNSNMFRDFTNEELRLAKEAMSSTKQDEEHVLNIDVAKMMLLFSGLVYERSISQKREALKKCLKMDWSHIRNDETEPLLPNRHHDLFSRLPNRKDSLIGNALIRGSGDSLYAPGPSAFPHRVSLYGTFPAEFTRWQQEFVSQSPFSSTAKVNPREASEDSKAAAAKDSGVIYNAMKKWGVEYEPLSELDSDDSAYCAAFWDKDSNWVAVSFKGTSPPAFDEWLVDFDYTRVPVGDYIPDYGSVHRGIKNRLFPDEPTLNRTPYGERNSIKTIVASLKVITDDLLSRTTSNVVNVYFTGHSLGAGIATLAHARAMQQLDGLDPRVRICDAYLFSSPIVSDMRTAELFNQQLASTQNGSKSVWRLVNHRDAVATLFPAMGDDPHYSYPDSLFAFAHLGTEVKMKRKGTKSIVSNNYAKSTASASATSALPSEQVGEVPGPFQVPKWMIWAQYVPLAGWMFSHFPGLYFESVYAMQEGEMEWKRKGRLD